MRVFFLPSIGFSLALLLFAPVLWAQTAEPTPEEIAARRTLLEQAQSASNGGDHAGAVRLAEQAARIQSTPSVRYFLAREQRELGRFSSAAGNAEVCIREAEHNANVSNREVLLTSCRSILQEIRSTGGFIALSLPSGMTGTPRVSIRGEVIPSSLLTVPVLVPSGSIRIEASMEGRPDWSQVVPVTRGETSLVEIFGGTVSAPTRRAAPATSSPLATAGPWVLGVGGGIGLALGVGFLVGSELSASGCGAPMRDPTTREMFTPCPYPDATQRIEQSNLFAGLAVSGFVTAGVAASVGVSMLVLGRSSARATEQDTALAPTLVPGGLGLRGHF